MRTSRSAVFKWSVLAALAVGTAPGMAKGPVAQDEGAIKAAMVRVVRAPDPATARAPVTPTPNPAPKPMLGLIVYEPPPDIKAPTGRVGGGPRGAAGSTARLDVLAPAHVGRTSNAQPVIYWYVSDAVRGPVDVFLSSADDREALLDITLEPPIAAGVHHVSLAEHGVHLAVGHRYKFHVFLRSVGDGPQSTAAIAVLERVAARHSAATPAAAKQADPASAYARDGLWFDAMQAVSEQVERGTESGRAREIRAQLLEQVGLASVAAYDRRQ